MNIRCASKAVILRGEEILLQECETLEGELYYELPGGGQNYNETMEEAVIRECLEETGYAVEVVRFLALLEEIMVTERLIAQYPGHAHRVFHVYLCRILDVPRVTPTEVDDQQLAMRWMPVAEVASLSFRPKALGDSLVDLLARTEPAYPGSRRIDSIV